jgi:hypothetical protein
MSGMSEGPRELLISTGKAESGGVLVAVQDSGPGLAPDARASLRRLLHDYVERVGYGSVDLPFYHRSARRTVVDEPDLAARCHVSIHRAYRCRGCIVIGSQAHSPLPSRVGCPAHQNGDTGPICVRKIDPGSVREITFQ